MGWLRGRLKQVRALLRKDAVERELDEELAFHLEMETQKNVAAGLSPEEARRAAVVAFRGVDRFKEEVRDARWTRLLEDAVADVRYAARSHARRPAFALAAVLTLGLGIGGTTAVFGVADAIFLRPPAGVREPESVARVLIVRDEGMIRTPQGGPGSYLDYEALRDGVHGVERVAAMLHPRRLSLGRGAEAEEVVGRAVSHGYFELLGIRPAAGRFFLEEEDGVAGAHPVAVVSHAFWRTRLGGAADVAGRTLDVSGERLTVVGVAQEGFSGIDPEPVDLWVPTAMAGPLGMMFDDSGEWRTEPGMAAVRLVARLASGADRDATSADAAAALARAAEAQPGMDADPRVMLTSLIPGRTPHRGEAATLALWLLLVAGMVLVIACANVANLILARTSARQRELAVRRSLGAGRGRMVRQHLTETLLLAGAGGGVGVLIALLGAGLARQFPLPPSAGALDGRMLAFAAGVSILTGLVIGVAPALRSATAPPAPDLKEAAGSATPNRGRARQVLVGVQVALSLVLLLGAGLFLRSLGAVYALEPGIDLERLHTVSVDLRRAGYSAEQRESFHAAARERVARVPGVEGAAMVHFAPLGGMAMAVPFDVPGRDSLGFTEGPYVNFVGSDYFRTAGHPLLEGRLFGAEDGPGSEPVIIINREMARLLGPHGAVGACLPVREQVREGGCSRIIGIVADVRHRLLEDRPVPQILFPRERDLAANPSWGGPVLLVRAPADRADAIRTAVQSMGPDLPYVTVRPLEEEIRADILPYRLGATLFTLFGLLALTLAAIGVHAVLSYFVAERTAEIGIRRSLGAPVNAVVRLVVGQGMGAVVVGLGLGLVLALAGSRLLSSLLFGVPPRDPVTFLAVPAFLLAVAVAATLLPARRAAAVDPMIALRES